MKITLLKAWNLAGKVEGQVNDDGTDNFYFRSEHHLLTILENAPYTFNSWMVAFDRWNQRELPQFLKAIPFWIQIENLPNIFRREQIVRSIGSKLGHVEDVEISEPIVLRPAEVWVKVRFNVDDEFTLHSFDVCPHPPNIETQSFQLMQIDPVTTHMDTSVIALPSPSDQVQGQSIDASILTPILPWNGSDHRPLLIHTELYRKCG
ncbi:unnamed protein product [Thlaspi arvense]|uniref:DUF4283 domain-containing protein n=1 Tax=Thlaspi arvense TaxID=13288 RepID=A0AAU9RXB3_THLAR|nr:unnamed protein product [Thlaspi arvense]